MNDTVTIGTEDVALADLDFNRETQRVTYNSTDVTNLLTFSQLATFDGFNKDAFLKLKYNEHFRANHGGKDAPAVGSVSFTENLVKDFDPLLFLKSKEKGGWGILPTLSPVVMAVIAILALLVILEVTKTVKSNT